MHAIPRLIKPKVLEHLQLSPIVFLNGPRQAGKSTLAIQLAAAEFSAEYVTFDNPTQMSAAITAPLAFLQNKPNSLIIDEVQMVPEIFSALKVTIDQLRLQNLAPINGKFLLTGSANIMALPNLATALVGRMSITTLYPFATAEVVAGKGDFIAKLFAQEFKINTAPELSVLTAIKYATFPEISQTTPKQAAIWFDAYIATLLQREIKMFAELEKIAILPNLVRLLAARAGCLINEADIARDLGINPVTTKNYRNVLKMMFLNFDINPWFRNINKRLVKASKGYLIDTLLLTHVLGTDPAELKQKKPEVFGHILENFVASELMKLLSFSDVRAKLHHFRTNDNIKVDFVLERSDGTLAAIEVKMNESVTAQDFKGINALKSYINDDFVTGIVLYSGTDIVPFSNNTWAVPLSILWQ